jgi:hypothetical protein
MLLAEVQNQVRVVKPFSLQDIPAGLRARNMCRFQTPNATVAQSVVDFLGKERSIAVVSNQTLAERINLIGYTPNDFDCVKTKYEDPVQVASIVFVGLHLGVSYPFLQANIKPLMQGQITETQLTKKDPSSVLDWGQLTVFSCGQQNQFEQMVDNAFKLITKSPEFDCTDFVCLSALHSFLLQRKTIVTPEIVENWKKPFFP